jgi:hypothetical protein
MNEARKEKDIDELMNALPTLVNSQEAFELAQAAYLSGFAAGLLEAIETQGSKP